MRGKLQAGFTLIEILVAIGIFSLLSVGAYRVVNGLIGSRDRIETHNEDARKLMRAIRLLDADFEQIVNRSIIDEAGEKRPPLDVDTGRSDLDGLIVEFSRQGYRNPLLSRRSEIIRVAYAVQEELERSDMPDQLLSYEDGKNTENQGYLIRYIWPVLDRAGKSDPEKQIILSGVSSFELSYLSKEKEWESTIEKDDENSSGIPYAIRISLAMKNGSSIDRVYALRPIKNEKK